MRVDVEAGSPRLSFAVDVDRFPSYQGALRRGRRHYVSSEARGYQRRISNAALAALEADPIHGRARARWLVRAWFCYPVRLRSAMHISARTERPDCDNLWKLVGDALEGVVCDDDSQLWSVQVSRVWRSDLDRCRLVVELFDRWDLRFG